MTKKTIVISGWYGNGNAGDEAILTSMLASLRQMNDELEITVFSDDPESTEKQYGVRALNRISEDDKWKRRRAIYDCDLFVLGGGGLLKDFGDWDGNLPFWLDNMILAKFLRKPVMLYGIGAGLIYTKKGNFYAKHVVSRADIITVRDYKSKEILASLGVSKERIKVTADPALLLKPAVSEVMGEIMKQEDIPINSSLRIGVCLRHWYYRVKSLNEEEGKIFENLKRSTAEVLDWLVEDKDAEIIFIPLMIRGDDDDREIARDVVDLMKNSEKTHMVNNEYTPEITSGMIGSMSMIIGMRLHSLIFAATQNTPMIAISYDPKVKGFMEMIDEEKATIEVVDVNFNILKRKIEDILLNMEDIKSDMHQKVEILCNHAKLNPSLAIELMSKKV